MDPPHGTVEAPRTEQRRAKELLHAQRFSLPEDILTEDQREVMRILGDMGRAYEQERGTSPIPSTSSRTSDADSDAAMKALAALDHDDRITPPPLLSLGQDGLPPTPPTLTSSEVADPKPVPTLSPAPHIFADRVRNALSHKSGFSTPVQEAHSPPTPDRSPPSAREVLIVPRPRLIHAYSSFADSFKTAREGLSSGESMSQLHSPIDEQLPNLKLLDVPARDGVISSGSDTGTATQTDGSDGGPARVKNYHMESDSDADKAASLHTGGSDGHTSSPTIQQALAHPSGYQHRLRAPIKPGDDITRIDNALLYSSSTWKPRVTASSVPVSQDLTIDRDPTPRREMDTEKLRNALPAQLETPTLIRNVTPQLQNDTQREDPPEGTPLPSAPVADQSSPEFERTLEPTSPSTTIAGQAILEGNNATYQFIQKENEKRYSAISEGSGVQAVVVTTPERMRTLRHTPKRESLRGDVSMASNSKRSSLDSTYHKLKHKRAMPSLDDGSNESGSPKVEPEEFYRRDVRPARVTNVSMPITHDHRHHAGKTGFRSLSGDTGADYLRRKAAFVAWHASARTPTLRRSVRGQGLDRILSLQVGDGMTARPWSAEPSEGVDEKGIKQEDAVLLHQLRRTSAEKRLSNMSEVRRTSLGRSDLSASPQLRRSSAGPRSDRNGDAKQTTLSPSPELRRSSVEQRLENNSDARQINIERKSPSIKLAAAVHDDDDRGSFRERRKSSDRTTATSPRRKSFDLRHLHPVVTPLSTSQFSGTEGELCEARGVEIFPHNNHSLLLVHGNGLNRELGDEADTNPVYGPQRPMFQAFIEPPESPMSDIGIAKHSVASPLTNPRAAPEPPKLIFIPPTPVDELENQVGDSGAIGGTNADTTGQNSRNLQKRSTLTEKVRRYSASLVQPVPFGRSNSFRRKPEQRPQTSPDHRDTYLNPFWTPRNFWSEYSSSDDEEDDLSNDRLPPGGDTSDVKENRSSFFPRVMSVRMPGFRGQGGFLQGNSLGLDRHGTNNRRHYIAKRTSEEMLQRMVERRRRRTFTLPFTGGTRVEYVGLAAFSARVRDARRKRNERAAEKRRDALRSQIGMRFYHEGPK